MAISALWLILDILGMIICGIVVVIFQIKYNIESRKIDIKPNSPIMDMKNRRQFTNGYMEGRVKTQLPMKNGTWFFAVYPTDGEQGENIPLPPVQEFIVKEEYIERYAKGELSARQEVIKIAPRSKLDMPKKMRDTLEGDYESKKGAEAFIEETVGMETDNAFRSIIAIHRHRALGEFSQEEVELAREKARQINKMTPPQGQEHPPEEKK